ncbi:C39 family peptidase [Corynebacterium aquilae]|uniref:C39 family peptidase n=1 Tax=Corynebacterium aquilae TaxID=203263 RepID=UPI000952E407|nr:C39 family peptidase [Corynebacterium aquilae]
MSDFDLNNYTAAEHLLDHSDGLADTTSTAEDDSVYSDPVATPAVSAPEIFNHEAFQTGSEGPLGLTSEDIDNLNWIEDNQGGMFAYAADGTYIALDGPTGTITVQYPDGTITQVMADGATYTWGPGENSPASGEDAIDVQNTGDYTYEYDNTGTDYSPETVDDVPVIEEWDGVYGNSYAWHDDWFYQEVNGYCGPTSVAIIANEFLGEQINNPDYVVSIAYELGLVEDISEGMYPDDICQLLNAMGVPATLTHSSMEDLAAKLEMGYGVLASVDSGEIWGDDEADFYREDNVSDHALVVTEINVYEGTVTLADPGTPDGNGLQVSIEKFADAWEDSGFRMIVTQQQDANLMDEELLTPVSAGGSMTENSPNLALVNLSGTDPIK